MSAEITKVAIFKGKHIRRILVKNEWWFSVIDVVSVLTDSENPRDYWYKMKVREKSEAQIELSTLCRQLKLTALDGKKRETDCANTENIFRIIQSIPSPKAEPFKRWLARIGKERLDEIENPELGMQRTKEIVTHKAFLPLKKTPKMVELWPEEPEKISNIRLGQKSLRMRVFFRINLRSH